MSSEPILPSRREQAEREAARLRYELSRLRAKRSVRLALLASKGSSPRELLATVRGTRVEPDLDVIVPATVARRPAYPHLRVAHDAAVAPFGWVAEHVHVSTAPELATGDVDMLVTGNGSHGNSDRLVAAARELEVPVVHLVEHPTSTRIGADLTVGVAATGAGHNLDADVVLPPWVDATIDNPIDWNPDAPPILVEVSDPLEATRQALVGLARGRFVIARDPASLPDAIAEHVTEATASGAVDAAADDPGERERMSIRARRLVLSDFEALARFEQVLAALAIPVRPVPRISVLMATRRPDQLIHAIQQVERQDHPELELVLLLHGDGFPTDSETRVRDATTRPVSVHRIPAPARFGDVLNIGLDAATGDLIAKMDDDDHYGPRHLSDLLLALRYSQADIVGRWANEVHVADDDITVVRDLDREERWAHHLPGGTLLAHADVMKAVRFRRVNRAIDTHLLRSIHAAGGVAYATHRFGYIRTRGGPDHTFEAHPEAAGASAVRQGLDLSVLDA